VKPLPWTGCGVCGRRLPATGYGAETGVHRSCAQQTRHERARANVRREARDVETREIVARLRARLDPGPLPLR
jgi:hypothetical protein